MCLQPQAPEDAPERRVARPAARSGRGRRPQAEKRAPDQRNRNPRPQVEQIASLETCNILTEVY